MLLKDSNGRFGYTENLSPPRRQMQKIHLVFLIVTMGVCLLSINAVPLVNLPQGEDLQRIDSEQPSYVFGYQGNDDLHISESMLSQYVG